MDNINYSWVEKYRPTKLDDISSQDNIVITLKNTLNTKIIPHLLFYGPSGCGKTSTILALTKELFGNEVYSNRIMELNASDERGINIIRDKIKKYAKQLVNAKNDLPPWKLIILDEADTMTPDSQFALRRIIEKYSNITRFCIICNYYTKIIDPIISRCAIFQFKALNDIQIKDKLEYICKQENINYSEIILSRIIKLSRGDLRKAINFLQKCYNLYGDNFNNELLNEMSGIIPNNIFNNLIDNVFSKNINIVQTIINQIYLDGYSLVNQILLFHDYIINADIDSHKKSQIIYMIATIDHNIIKGCSEYIQFMKLIYYMMNIL